MEASEQAMVIAIVRDITARKETEEALKRQAVLLELVPDSIIVQTSPKFPLRWWGINSTLSSQDQLDEHQSHAGIAGSSQCEKGKVCDFKELR